MLPDGAGPLWRKEDGVMGEDQVMELGPFGIAGLAVLFMGVLYWAFRARRGRPPGDEE
jgi:hypothetical protein